MTPRSRRTGPLLWLAAVQFFVAQFIVANAWPTAFNIATRYISDLGNTSCGPYPNPSSPVVCSPWHSVMNASFIIIGITMSAGRVSGVESGRA